MLSSSHRAKVTWDDAQYAPIELFCAEDGSANGEFFLTQNVFDNQFIATWIHPENAQLKKQQRSTNAFSPPLSDSLLFWISSTGGLLKRTVGSNIFPLCAFSPSRGLANLIETPSEYCYLHEVTCCWIVAKLHETGALYTPLREPTIRSKMQLLSFNQLLSRNSMLVSIF